MTLRLDDDLHHGLTTIARAQNITLSELARQTLATLLRQDRSPLDNGDQNTGYAPVPTTISTIERQQLALLHRILANVIDDTNEESDPESELESARILEKGYVSQYGETMQSIEAELSRRDAAFVMDVMEMFHFIEWSFHELDDSERNELGEFGEDMVAFSGFDFNDRRESRLAGYARHLLAQDRWESLAKYFDRAHDRGNSHRQMASTYSRMLDEFQPIWREKTRGAMLARPSRYQLTKDELKTVIDAAIHPSNR